MEGKGQKEAQPTVLLVSNDPEAVKWLEAAAEGLAVRQVAPRELDHGAEWLDAAVAVAHWRADDGPSALDALVALRELPVAERILLVADAEDPVELERLIAALQPQAWLPDPPPTGRWLLPFSAPCPRRTRVPARGADNGPPQSCSASALRSARCSSRSVGWRPAWRPC